MIKGRRSCVDNLMSGVALAETRMRTSIHPPVAPRPLVKKGDFLNQSSDPRSAIALRQVQLC
jgi:hypothetical protein